VKDLSHKNQFVKTFNSLCARYPKFTVWNDFIYMSAYAISNAYDYRQDREDHYLNIVKRYTKDEVDKIAELFALTVRALEDNRHQDFLGQLYMESGFGDNRKGEYFTPYEIAEFMAQLTDNGINDCGYVTVNDPACGSGVMLIAYANRLLESGINPHFRLLVVANDINPCVALMCYIQLSLLGCAGYVCIRDTLANPVTGSTLLPPEDAFVTPLFFHPIWKMRRTLKILTKGERHGCSESCQVV